MRILIPAMLMVALAGCNDARGDTGSLAEANASGAQATETVQNAVASSNAAPVDKATALRIIKERHEGYERIGKAMKAAKRALDGGSPDVATVRQSAATVAQMAPKVTTWFPAGSGVESGGKTGARAEIWQKGDVFAAKARDFNNAARAFQAAAGGTDVNRMKSAFADLGKTCKSCHDQFRKDDH